jgi:hypothetical protein
MFRRSADFLKHGEGVWYKVLEDGIIFFDGPDDDEERGPQQHVKHFR